jgi:hypothetical protein
VIPARVGVDATLVRLYIYGHSAWQFPSRYSRQVIMRPAHGLDRLGTGSKSWSWDGAGT